MQIKQYALKHGTPTQKIDAILEHLEYADILEEDLKLFADNLYQCYRQNIWFKIQTISLDGKMGFAYSDFIKDSDYLNLNNSRLGWEGTEQIVQIKCIRDCGLPGFIPVNSCARDRPGFGDYSFICLTANKITKDQLSFEGGRFSLTESLYLASRCLEPSQLTYFVKISGRKFLNYNIGANDSDIQKLIQRTITRCGNSK